MDASAEIDRLIEGLTNWRGQTLAAVRRIVLGADPQIIEEWKWMGSPVWSCAGNLLVGNAHKDKVKLTFSHGASLEDPKGLFNAGLDGKVWRAIDLGKGDVVDADALADLVREAVALNRAKAAAKAGSKASARK